MKTSYDRPPLEQILEYYGIAAIHPVLDLVPMLSDDEFQILCQDVDQLGFLHSIRINDDALLIDGRSRLQVGWTLSLDPHIERFNPPDVLAYVLSENVIRRHLTVDQQTLIAQATAKSR